MLNVYILVSVALAIVFILLGFLVATRNITSNSNRLFLIFSTFIAGWLVTNYIGGAPNYSHSVALIANKLVFLFGILTVTSLLLFIKNLVGRKNNLFWNTVLGLNIVFALLSLTTTIVSSVKLENDTYAISFGALSVPYFLLLLFDVIGLLLVALIGKRHAKGQLKSQINTILISLAITLVGVIITNALVPFVFGFYGLSNSGAFLTAVLVFGIAYSIIRHKLFDIRPFVARSVAYLLLLGTLSVIFIGSLFVLSTLFFKDQSLSTGVKLVYVLIALAIALMLQPLKRFFDKNTNRLFYRDAYDSQELLNSLNRSLVTTIDLGDLLNKSSHVIRDNIKIEHCFFAIYDSRNQTLRYIGEPNIRIDDQVIHGVISNISSLRDKVVVSDELGTQRYHLKELMQKSNTAVVVKLQGRIGGNIQHPGYILLGQKRSGGLYSAQDVGVLEIIADELVIAIQNSLRFEEIQQFNITLQDKVDDATKQLRHANIRLKELDQTKDEFISMASHQLRTPLTTIKGYLSMILEGDVGEVRKNQEPLIKQAFDSSQNMVDLIADLLNISRLQSGKFVIDNQPTQLADMVDAEVKRMAEQAGAKNIKLTFQKPSDTPVLNIDATKIRQVVMNFLDNSIYYTPNGGNVSVELATTPSSVTYTVTDNGMGVPKAVQHHLFSKFYRADNAKKMRPDGTGLGLFMAKKVIAAQGGAIVFKSEEGKGSTFGFSFPRSTTEVKAGANTVKTPAK